MLGERFAPVLARAQEADPDAFADLWKHTQPMLLRYLVVIAGSHAEDVASQTWLRVIEALGSFTGSEPQFRRWLVTIARNLHVDLVRRAARRSEVLVAEPLESETPAAPDAGQAVEERLSTEAALRLVARLPQGQAELVMLRVVVGLDVAAAAEVVGRSPGAVRVAVHRGLRTLERLLAESSDSDVTPTHPLTFSSHDA